MIPIKTRNFDGEVLFDMLETKNKTTVPIVCFRVKNAKYTIIYSHGNATDIGAMYIRYQLLALALR